MKYYNTELTLAESEKFRCFLYGMGVKHESSACYNLIHFEMLLDEDSEEFQKISDFLNSL